MTTQFKWWDLAVTAQFWASQWEWHNKLLKKKKANLSCNSHLWIKIPIKSHIKPIKKRNQYINNNSLSIINNQRNNRKRRRKRKLAQTFLEFKWAVVTVKAALTVSCHPWTPRTNQATKSTSRIMKNLSLRSQFNNKLFNNKRFNRLFYKNKNNSNPNKII